MPNDEQPPSLAFIYVHTVRFFPRARLLHIALPSTEWTLCERSRVGRVASEDELGTEIGGVTVELCSRCEVRRRMLRQGLPTGRSDYRSVQTLALRY